MVKTVDDTCEFIAKWCQEPGGYPGQLLANDFAVPDCVARLNARVGDLWRSAERVSGPVLRYVTPFLGLLDGQDRILNPNEYARNENGVVLAVWENQGVWGCGFDPNDVDRLLVCGDWCDGLQEDFETEWRRVEAKLEDALVCTLLINLCMESNANWDDNTPKPETAHIALWAHPAWSDFEGFWINDGANVDLLQWLAGYSQIVVCPPVALPRLRWGWQCFGSAGLTQRPLSCAPILRSRSGTDENRSVAEVRVESPMGAVHRTVNSVQSKRWRRSHAPQLNARHQLQSLEYALGLGASRNSQ